jgi:hypothetical protein
MDNVGCNIYHGGKLEGSTRKEEKSSVVIGVSLILLSVDSGTVEVVPRFEEVHRYVCLREHASPNACVLVPPPNWY